MSSDCPISVVIPCSNSAAYLASSVASVALQELPGVEIVIVDDASTDNSLLVAQTIAARTPGTIVLSQAVHCGRAAALNRGARASRGRYLCFLDADDTYAPRFFRSVLPLLDAQRQLAAVATGIELLNCTGELDPGQRKALIMSTTSNLMIRHSVFDLLDGFPEDEPFHSRERSEDAAFRQALNGLFHVGYCDEQYLRDWIHSETDLNPAPASSSLAADDSLRVATQRYLERASLRLSASKYLKAQP